MNAILHLLNLFLGVQKIFGNRIAHKFFTQLFKLSDFLFGNFDSGLLLLL